MLKELERLKGNLAKAEDKYFDTEERLEKNKQKILEGPLEKIKKNQDKIKKYLEKVVDCSILSKKEIVSVYVELFNVFESEEVDFVSYDYMILAIKDMMYKNPLYNPYFCRSVFHILGVRNKNVGYLVPKSLVQKMTNKTLTQEDLFQLLSIMLDDRRCIYGNFMTGSIKFYEIDDKNNNVRFMFSNYPDYFKTFIDFAIDYRVKNNLQELESEQEKEMFQRLKKEFLDSRRKEIIQLLEEQEKADLALMESNSQRRKLILDGISGNTNK